MMSEEFKCPTAPAMTETKNTLLATTSTAIKTTTILTTRSDYPSELSALDVRANANASQTSGSQSENVVCGVPSSTASASSAHRSNITKTPSGGSGGEIRPSSSKSSRIMHLIGKSMSTMASVFGGGSSSSSSSSSNQPHHCDSVDISHSRCSLDRAPSAPSAHSCNSKKSASKVSSIRDLFLGGFKSASKQRQQQTRVALTNRSCNSSSNGNNDDDAADTPRRLSNKSGTGPPSSISSTPPSPDSSHQQYQNQRQPNPTCVGAGGGAEHQRNGKKSKLTSPGDQVAFQHMCTGDATSGGELQSRTAAALCSESEERGFQSPAAPAEHRRSRRGVRERSLRLKQKTPASVTAAHGAVGAGRVNAIAVCSDVNSWSQDYDEEDFMDAFRVFDTDGDGCITAKELQHVLKELGIQMSKQDIQKMIGELDNDGNGTIEYSEFVHMMTMPVSKQDDEFELREAFKCIDLDGNGFISREELKDAVKHIMSTDSRISGQDVEEMMTEADVDGNGLIDFDEFVRVLVEKRN